MFLDGFWLDACQERNLFVYCTVCTVVSFNALVGHLVNVAQIVECTDSLLSTTLSLNDGSVHIGA